MQLRRFAFKPCSFLNLSLTACIIFSASIAKAQNSVEIVGAMSKPATTPYQADYQRRIKRAWFPPKGNESKIVTVQFSIAKDGAISNLGIENSSGIATVDNAALMAIKNAAPFRALPEDVGQSISVQYTFDYAPVSAGGRKTQPAQNHN